MARKALLVCGILASLVYVGADVVATFRYAGYSYTSQMVSELMAIAAPTRPLLVTLFTVHNVLAIAFGVGIWMAAAARRPLRVTAVLVVVYGVVGEIALLFFPMHLRGAETSLTDTMHIIATSVIVLLTLLYIGFGAAGRGKGFRLYSIATIVTLLICGGLAGSQGPRVGANLPTPGFGIMERINIYSSLLWFAVLAVGLLRPRETAPPVAARRPVGAAQA